MYCRIQRLDHPPANFEIEGSYGVAFVTESGITHTALYYIVCDRGYSYLVNMQGLERCPFLREVAEREGQQYAAHIACRPTVPFVRSAVPVLREDACDFAATFQLFHGPAGVVPLRSGILSSGARLVAAAINVAMPRRLSLPSSA
jgi:hypothetical protein